MKVSLIMCTVGRVDVIHRLLESLRSQPSELYELVIVDQNKEGFLDEVLEKARSFASVTYCRSSPGLSRARNVGLAAATGSIVAFPDDDCWYPDGAVEFVVKFFLNNPSLGFISGRTCDGAFADSNGRFLSSTQPITRDNVWLSGNSNSIFCLRACAEDVKGFNELLGVGSGSPYGSGEETDFILKLLGRGYKGQFKTDFFIHHDQVAVAVGDMQIKRAKSYARGFGAVLRMHGFGLRYAIVRSLRSCAAVAVGLILGNFVQVRVKANWATGILEGYWRASSDRALFPQKNNY